MFCDTRTPMQRKELALAFVFRFVELQFFVSHFWAIILPPPPSPFLSIEFSNLSQFPNSESLHFSWVKWSQNIGKTLNSQKCVPLTPSCQFCSQQIPPKMKQQKMHEKGGKRKHHQNGEIGWVLPPLRDGTKLSGAYPETWRQTLSLDKERLR